MNHCVFECGCDLHCPLAQGTFCAAVFKSRALSCPSTARKIHWIPPTHTHTLTSIPQKPQLQLPYPLLSQALKHTETNLFTLYDLFYTRAFSLYISSPFTCPPCHPSFISLDICSLNILSA